MNEKCVPSEQVQAMLSEIRAHLLRAQELIDSIDPNSILAARLQHIIDDLPKQSSGG
jgi:hypothetical protein